MYVGIMDGDEMDEGETCRHLCNSVCLSLVGPHASVPRGALGFTGRSLLACLYLGASAARSPPLGRERDSVGKHQLLSPFVF